MGRGGRHSGGADASGTGHESAFKTETVIIKLRALVDAEVAHAAGICLHYQEIADQLVALEIKAAHAERVAGEMRLALRRARAEWRGCAIAARMAPTRRKAPCWPDKLYS